MTETTEISELEETAAGASDQDRVFTLRSLIDDALQSESEFEGIFVVDLVVRGHKGSRVVEVFLDGDEALSIDRVSRAGRFVNGLLEANEDVIGGTARLEVSSPGVKRSLLIPRQYAKHVGRKLQLKRAAEDGGRIVGILRRVGDAEIELEVGSDSVAVSFNQIVEGKVALPW